MWVKKERIGYPRHEKDGRISAGRMLATQKEMRGLEARDTRNKWARVSISGCC